MSTITLENLSKNWLGLTTDYRPSAFWFWNSDMEPEDIELTISEMHRQGIREFLIHPIHGLGIEYLSEVFFERCRYTFRLAKKYNLKAWIYDEYGWPSGNAGGRLLEKYPEHKSWFLRFAKSSDGTVTAVPFLSDRILDNVVGASWTKSIPGYVDTLSKDAVQCFIEMTYDRYYQECGEFFGDVIVGFFTDEPVTMVGCEENQCELWNTVGLPWTPELPKLFEREFGYDIEKCYTKLACPDESELKRDYWKLVKKLHGEAYHGQISKWCGEHKIKYSGHIGENVPLMQSRFSAGAFTSLGYMDEPGVDMLGCEPYPEHRFLEQVLVSSIARHLGRKRVYCEAFGIAPFNLRLGEMLRCSEMLGIHGINDIALMGFHQSLDGVRKRMYWPPLFKGAPWWQFYPAYCDAVARSVGLTSSGNPKHRYAILYPQYHLEQSDLFTELWSGDEPVLKKITALASAIYEAGETFEFVFAESLSEMHVKNGMLVLGDIKYFEMLIPADLMCSDEIKSELQRLSKEGGRVEHGSNENIIIKVNNSEPLWRQLFHIDCQDSRNFRIYQYEFLDGALFVLRNVTEARREISISTKYRLNQWDPMTGECINRQGHTDFLIEPNSTKYFSISSKSFGNKATDYSKTVPVECEWTIKTDIPNMARLENLQFYHEGHGWLDPEYNEPVTSLNPVGFIPSALNGKTRIRMRGRFRCNEVPAELGLVYEQSHLLNLTINNEAVELKDSQSMPVWDSSCRYIEVFQLSHMGENEVEGTLLFEKFETSLFSHGFFRNRPVMPSCDICMVGSFKVVENVLSSRNPNEKFVLPCDLGESGWSQYSGKLYMATQIFMDGNLSEQVGGLEIELISEDALEVFWDENSVEQKITSPYKFRLGPVTPGQHKLELVISSTSGNILADTSPWGIKAVKWLLK